MGTTQKLEWLRNLSRRKNKMSKTKYYIGSDELKLGVWIDSLITDICTVYEYKYTMDSEEVEKTFFYYISSIFEDNRVRLNNRTYSIDYDNRPLTILRDIIDYIDEDICLNDWLLEYEVPRPMTEQEYYNYYEGNPREEELDKRESKERWEK